MRARREGNAPGSHPQEQLTLTGSHVLDPCAVPGETLSLHPVRRFSSGGIGVCTRPASGRHDWEWSVISLPFSTCFEFPTMDMYY